MSGVVSAQEVAAAEGVPVSAPAVEANGFTPKMPPVVEHPVYEAPPVVEHPVHEAPPAEAVQVTVEHTVEVAVTE